MNRIQLAALALPAALLASSPLSATPADEDLAQEDRMRELERKVELLTEELARTRQDMAVPEDGELTSAWGMGPGASKIYGIAKGLSIGGYAEGRYTAVVADKKRSGEHNEADFTRVVLYTGYKFTDNIVFNTEIEFEHGSTEENGSVSVEFATLDYLIRDEVNARAGLLLLPMGFINEVHEPPFYYGTHRPEVEEELIPTTWRDVGGGLFGRIAEIVDYKLYAVTSLDAAGFDASGIRDGRQQGSESIAEDVAFVGRLDVEPLPELVLGGSVFVGNTGQDQNFDVNGDGFDDVGLPNALLTLWEVHGEYATHGLRTRALFTMSYLDQAGKLTRDLGPAGTGALAPGEAIANRTLGGYGEVAYEILQWIAPSSGWTAEPFVRIEHVDTQNSVPSGYSADKTDRFQVYTVGMQVKPIPNVVLKLDYRNRVAKRGALGDEVNVGIGVVF
jgi:hypothetical protein